MTVFPRYLRFLSPWIVETSNSKTSNNEGHLYCHYLVTFLDSVEADGHVVHVEDELAQVAEEEAEDHQDQDPGKVRLSFALSVRLKYENRKKCQFDYF